MRCPLDFLSPLPLTSTWKSWFAPGTDAEQRPLPLPTHGSFISRVPHGTCKPAFRPHATTHRKKEKNPSPAPPQLLQPKQQPSQFSGRNLYIYIFCLCSEYMKSVNMSHALSGSTTVIILYKYEVGGRKKDRSDDRHTVETPHRLMANQGRRGCGKLGFI